MPISAIFTGNITKQMYETLKKEVKWDQNPPAGLISHSAAFDEPGNSIHVADIWESEQDLNNFVENRLIPVMKNHNIPIPKSEIFQIHEINVYPGIDRYR